MTGDRTRNYAGSALDPAGSYRPNMAGRGRPINPPATPGTYGKGRRLPEIATAERWYTADQVAELLHMSAQWVRDRRKEGKLKGVKITNAGRGQYRFSESAVQAFMASLPDATT